MRTLVLNAGSSSLKASVVDGGATVSRASAGWGSDASRSSDRGAGLRAVLGSLATSGAPVAGIEAVGHRVVHGGQHFLKAVLVDDAVEAGIGAVSELAPLHNAVALDTIRAARSALPDVPHVAAFDTAFHATLSEAATRYPVPEKWYTDWGIRRYGFHGLSVAWSTKRASELLRRDLHDVGLVVAHLGSGCSVTAVQDGHSVDTSMGMTPLEGLMMGTRAGSIDPGILLHLLREGRLDLDDLAETLDHGAGLLAVSGGASDMRELTTAAEGGDARAALAIEMFVRHAAAGIAASATALRKLDAVVFTGGIGEHAGTVRAAIVARLGVLGIATLRGESGPDEDAVLSGAASTPAVLRVEAREDLVIAEEVATILS